MAAPHALVTGAAGFIGSHLCERLLADGVTVTGIDCFTDYYDPALKRANARAALTHPRFTLLEHDLGRADLAALPEVTVVFHQAAQAGVRSSWGKDFAAYVHHNVFATQRLLERYRGSKLERFVYASSSSVYGDAERYPTDEAMLPRPFSPYGVTKLAGEHLVLLYGRNFGLPVSALRYFTVYGPRQRPDMAFHKFCRAMLAGEPIAVYGDGTQSRDFVHLRRDRGERAGLETERAARRLQRRRRIAGHRARGDSDARARARRQGRRALRAAPARRPDAHARGRRALARRSRLRSGGRRGRRTRRGSDVGARTLRGQTRVSARCGPRPRRAS
jgi:nucleoside-diphosphate-sugar epimerase